MSEGIIASFIPELGDRKKGKVRDIYTFQNKLILIASDRVSAFDVVSSDPILDKGKTLTQLSLFWFERTKDIIENHLIFSPDPNVMVVKKCRAIPIEIIVRKYVSGSLWKDYKEGKKEKCGLRLPKDLRENQELEYPIITPTTKTEDGHDEDISKAEILSRKIVSEEIFQKIEKTSLALFKRGQEVLDKCNMILVDTKYEFGLDESDKLVLIDELHTPDSSRFWFKEDYDEKKYEHQSKEFIRQYLIKSGFKVGQKSFTLPEDIKEMAREKYLKVFQSITKEKLRQETVSPRKRILQRLVDAKLICGYFALVCIDENLSDEIISRTLNDYQIPHKIIKIKFDGQALKDAISKYNYSIEPVVYIFHSENFSSLKTIEGFCNWPAIFTQLMDPKSAAMSAIRKLKNLR